MAESVIFLMMIDLHTHSILSDGELVPFELVRRAEAAGYSAIAITDHVDTSNIQHVVSTIARAAEKIKGHTSVDVLAGAELTHVPPALIAGLVKEARKLGAQIVVVHGETLAEPVLEGTNRAGIEAGADIIAHPGLITEEDVLLAKERGVALEITTRKGHSLSNGHVAKMALRHGARLVLNTDAHSPSDLVTKEMANKTLLAAGLEEEDMESVFETSRQIVEKALRRNNAQND